jgi:hypothetical protein
VADIPTGAVCTLDSDQDYGLAGLSIEGTMTAKSNLTVAPGGSSPAGTGDTSVGMGGFLTVGTPDIPGVSSTLDTNTLETAISMATNLTISDNSTVEIDTSATLGGDTLVNGLFDAKNIDAFTGATVTTFGTGTVGGNGQLEAGINATITFSGGTWTILTGNPVGSTLKEGDFHVDSTLDVNTHLNPDGHIFLDPGGTLAGTGDLDVVTSLYWLGGTLGPAGGTLIDSSGELQASGGSAKTLATDLTNETSFDTLGGGGGLTINNGVTFEVAAGTVDVSLPFITSSGSGLLSVGGPGTLNFQSPSTSPTVITSNFSNDGVVEVATGAGGELVGGFGATIDLDGEVQLEGDLTLLGTISSPTGLVLRAGGGTLKIGDADTDRTGSLSLTEGADLFGNVEVTSVGTLTSAAQVYNQGVLTLDMGSATTFASYQQSGSGGALKEQATGPGMNSLLTVTGAAQLAGTLELDFVGGYTPTSGDTFAVLTAGSIGGHFDSTPADMTADYGPTGVTLTQN